jgi:transcription elongation factor Elf1
VARSSLDSAYSPLRMGWFCPYCGARRTVYTYSPADGQTGFNRCSECRMVYRIELLHRGVVRDSRPGAR